MDPRVDAIADLIGRLGRGEFTAWLEPSSQGDELDMIIIGLRMLAQELEHARAVRQANEQEIRRQRDELQAAQEQLVRQARLAALGQLCATVSHELRNPLGTIKTCALLLETGLGTPSPMVERALARIDRNVQRCSTIIDELLEFAREPMVRFERVDLDAWLEELVSQEDLIPGVDVALAADSGRSLMMDAEQLRRCLVNLLSNAAHATRSRPQARIQLTASATDTETRLSVTDNGVGIPEEQLEHIFDPLFSTRANGVGLGLAICRKIAAVHGARLTVESTVGVGSVFSIVFPIQER